MLITTIILVVNGINKNEYREYQKGWWNTYQVKGHFGQFANLCFLTQVKFRCFILSYGLSNISWHYGPARETSTNERKKLAQRSHLGPEPNSSNYILAEISNIILTNRTTMEMTKKLL